MRCNFLTPVSLNSSPAISTLEVSLLTPEESKPDFMEPLLVLFVPNCADACSAENSRSKMDKRRFIAAKVADFACCR